MSTVAERVAAGAAYLDQAQPGWADRMNVLDLDLSSPCRCVLGQLYAEMPAPDDDYDDGFDYAVNQVPELASETDQVRLGFDAPSDCADLAAEWVDLTAEWRRAIEARRTA